VCVYVCVCARALVCERETEKERSSPHISSCTFCKRERGGERESEKETERACVRLFCFFFGFFFVSWVANTQLIFVNFVTKFTKTPN